MRTLHILKKVVILACASAVVSLTVSLWNATGRAFYTQQYDPRRAEQESASVNNLASLFDDTTPLPAGASPIGAVPNRFMLGLAPSTYPWRPFDPDLLSVLTLAGPALLIALVEVTPRFVLNNLCRRLAGRRRSTSPASSGVGPID